MDDTTQERHLFKMLGELGKHVHVHCTCTVRTCACKPETAVQGCAFCYHVYSMSKKNLSASTVPYPTFTWKYMCIDQYMCCKRRVG